jgi:alginate O-acetyltransferase complex protein AlgI
MPFTSVSFIYYFLPLALLSYIIAPQRLKNPVLLGAGLVFFAWGEPKTGIFLFLLAFSGYLHGLWLEHNRNTRRPGLPLLSAIIFNTGLLFLLKFTDLGANPASFFRAEPALACIVLPLGLGVSTLQVFSYCIDLYRGRVSVQRNFLDFATYACLFPPLIAGPIFPYRLAVAQIKERTHSWAETAAGIRTFILGLARKVILGNTLAQVGHTFARLDQPTVLFHWLAALAFLFQIYYDLSGYSDMALGLARIFGFRLPRNFNYPLLARSIVQFWRRWFISLGAWFRDYVYEPLTGKAAGPGRRAISLLAIGAMLGLWHGGGWNLMVWGLVFAGLILLERLVLGKLLDRLPRVVGNLYVLLVLLLNFVLFRGPGLQEGLSNLQAMLGLADLPWSSPETIFHLRSYSFTLLLAVIGATPLLSRLVARIRSSSARERVLNLLEPLVLSALLLLVTGYLTDGYFSPYAFFKF